MALSCTLVLGSLALARETDAQLTVREVARPSTPYVPLYSPCRAKPPNDAAAHRVFRSMWPQPSFVEFSRQLGLLRAKPVEMLSAAEAEAYFLLLGEIESRIIHERDASERVRATLLEGREHGIAIARRFSNDSFVRCAFLASEARIVKALGMRDRFSETERDKARDDYRAFMESALRGEVPTDMYRDVLQSWVGKSYFDRGFEALPDTDTAAPLFEVGAKHSFDAASNPTDKRYLANWSRYAFLLQKLPLAQRLEIGLRLLTYMEDTWGGKSARTAGALDVYIHLLNYVGKTSIAAKQGKAAVSIFRRQLEVMQELRRRDPRDPNHQVSEALGYLLFGDAHILDNNTGAAARAYDGAQSAFESSNALAKFMLVSQEFPEQLELRRKALR